MKQSTALWLLAFLLTCVAAYYQRITGSTYPLSHSLFDSEMDYNVKKVHQPAIENRTGK